LDVGISEGLEVGALVGLDVGISEGLEVGALVGLDVGISEGLEAALGVYIGATDRCDGAPVVLLWASTSVGSRLALEGFGDGWSVGALVGSGVGNRTTAR